ncbi:MAG: 2Fe-2S iron-sulfur cluster-binding protein [Bacteriovoracaceae bacterium]
MPKVTIIDTHQVFEIEKDSIIHDALDAQDLKLPHGCLAGSCGACRIEVLNPEALHPASAVEQNTIDALNDERKDAGLEPLEIRLSCRAKILTDVEIRLIKD